MNRREYLAATAACSVAVLDPLTAHCQPPPRSKMGLVIHSYPVLGRKPLPPEFLPVSDPLDFVAHAVRVGAGGVQIRVGIRRPTYLAILRETVEKHGLFLEGMTALPEDDAGVARFEAELAAGKLAGITVFRAVCLSGRRYETFATAEQFRQFADRSWAALQRAAPIAARQKVTIAVENHKDWRADEMAAWLKKLSSEHVGVCLDTGNNIALLEDPQHTAETLAPWIVSTHIKDMAVAEADDGFLLSEIPLGEGYLDMPKLVATVVRANTQARFNLEMITRDPLRVACLTAGYWATMPTVPARELADMLARVRKSKHPGPLPTVSKLPHAEQLKAERDNVAKSLVYARTKLGL